MHPQTFNLKLESRILQRLKEQIKIIEIRYIFRK